MQIHLLALELHSLMLETRKRRIIPKQKQQQRSKLKTYISKLKSRIGLYKFKSEGSFPASQESIGIREPRLMSERTNHVRKIIEEYMGIASSSAQDEYDGGGGDEELPVYMLYEIPLADDQDQDQDTAPPPYTPFP